MRFEMNSNSIYPICLYTLAIVAAVFIPVMVAVYRGVLIHRRLDDLRSNLWEPDAIKRYIAIFTPEDEDTVRDKKQLDTLIERVCLQIHGWWQYTPPMAVLTVLVWVV